MSISAPEELKWGPKKLRDWLNSLRAFALATKPIQGDNTTISETSSGTAINGAPFPATSGTIQRPWTPKKTDSGQIKLNPDSSVKDQDFNDMDVDGLTTAFDCPAIGDCVWVNIAIDNTPTPPTISAALHHGTFPGTFDSDGDTAAPAQTQFNAKVIEVTDPDSDPRPAALILTVSGERRQLTLMYDQGMQLIYAGHSGVSTLMLATGASLLWVEYN